MIAILRISERGVVRAIAEFRRFQVKVRGGLEGRIKSRVFCHGRPRMSKKMRVLAPAAPTEERSKCRSPPPQLTPPAPPQLLLDALRSYLTLYPRPSRQAAWARK